MRLRRILKLFAVTIIGLYVGVVGWMYTIQDQLAYAPSHQIRRTPHDVGLDYENVTITTSDGIDLRGWFIPALASHKTVLFFHGNGGSIDCCLDYAKLYQEFGFGILFIDYRGYGESAGTPSEQGLYTDAAAAWNYLTVTRGLPATQILIVGQSLGGGVATWLATQHTPAGLILDATFTSLPDVGARQYPWLPVRLLASSRFPSIDRIGALHAPLLMFHSRDDQLIPFNLGEQLYAAAQAPKTFVELHGSHGASLRANPAIYQSSVEAFIATLDLP